MDVLLKKYIFIAVAHETLTYLKPTMHRVLSRV